MDTVARGHGVGGHSQAADGGQGHNSDHGTNTERSRGKGWNRGRGSNRGDTADRGRGSDHGNHAEHRGNGPDRSDNGSWGRASDFHNVAGPGYARGQGDIAGNGGFQPFDPASCVTRDAFPSMEDAIGKLPASEDFCRVIAHMRDHAGGRGARNDQLLHADGYSVASNSGSAGAGATTLGDGNIAIEHLPNGQMRVHVQKPLASDASLQSPLQEPFSRPGQDMADSGDLDRVFLMRDDGNLILGGSGRDLLFGGSGKDALGGMLGGGSPGQGAGEAVSGANGDAIPMIGVYGGSAGRLLRRRRRLERPWRLSRIVRASRRQDDDEGPLDWGLDGAEADGTASAKEMEKELAAMSPSDAGETMFDIARRDDLGAVLVGEGGENFRARLQSHLEALRSVYAGQKPAARKDAPGRQVAPWNGSADAERNRRNGRSVELVAIDPETPPAREDKDGRLPPPPLRLTYDKP